MRTALLLTILSSLLLAADNDDNAEARRLATSLADQFGLADEIPDLKKAFADAIDESCEGFTPEEVALLKEYMAAEAENGFLPRMVDLIVRYFTLEELKAIQDEREIPSLMAKLPGWAKYCEEGGEVWGREARLRSERRIGAGIAAEVLVKLGIDKQIPALKAGFREKVEEIRVARGLTDAQTEKVKVFVDREIDANYKTKMAEWFAEYFSVHELKAVRDEREIEGLAGKMAGLGKFAEKKNHDWGVDVGRRAVEHALKETEDTGD